MINLLRNILILNFLSSIALAGNVNMRGTGEDCSNRRSNIVDIQNFVHNVAMVGDEDGRVLSNDPTTREAQIAEASGRTMFCNKVVGQLSLIEHNGKNYLLGSAHSFYDNGAIKCNDSTGMFYPDYHYRDANNPNIQPDRGYTYKLPPLNHDEALKDGFDNLSADFKNDFVLLEIVDQSLLQNQLGQDRASLQMASVERSRLPAISEHFDVQISSSRHNFQEGRNVAINENCNIKGFSGGLQHLEIMRHSCDTGRNSSGGSLISIRNDQPYSLGVHISAPKDSTISDEDFENTNLGNYFIPSDVIINTINRIERNTPQGETT